MGRRRGRNARLAALTDKHIYNNTVYDVLRQLYISTSIYRYAHARGRYVPIYDCRFSSTHAIVICHSYVRESDLSECTRSFDDDPVNTR